ncbi:MAG: amidohydrolase family protein [Thermodesulfovibrionales bacterium]|nr:amidohydrolase family protein [Thermodesulfovibrionales bacterium]
MHKVIDIHIHGIGGYDTRTTDVAHILKIAEIQGSHGVSEIIPTVYPATIKVMRENMAVVKKAMELHKVGCNSELLTPNSQLSTIIGVHLEGPFLNPSKSGALNAMTFIEPTERNLMELLEGFEDIIKIITIAPELDGAIKLIKKISDMGIIVSIGHSDAAYNEAEAGFKAGAKGITHLFNAMRSFHHREPGIAGFGLMNPDIYIEVIADPFHLHSETIDLIFKVKNSERIIIVSDTVKETTQSAKICGIKDRHDKLIGGCMTIIESTQRLIEIGFDKEQIMKCISENPERFLKRCH